MSGFVPLQKSSTFHPGVIAGEVGAEITPAGGSPTEADSPVDEQGESLEEPSVMLPSTPEELAALMDEVRAEARADAEAAMTTVRDSLEAEREQLIRLREKVEASRSAWAEEVRNMLGELVVVGVRQVVGDSADLQAEMLRDRFAEVGERLIGEQNVVVRVRPEDEDAARVLIGDREGWQVVPDSDLSGGIVAETDGGKVDATMGAALTGLADAVHGWQSEGAGEE